MYFKWRLFEYVIYTVFVIICPTCFRFALLVLFKICCFFSFYYSLFLYFQHYLKKFSLIKLNIIMPKLISIFTIFLKNSRPYHASVVIISFTILYALMLYFILYLVLLNSTKGILRIVVTYTGIPSLDSPRYYLLFISIEYPLKFPLAKSVSENLSVFVCLVTIVFLKYISSSLIIKLFVLLFGLFIQIFNLLNLH